MSLSDLRGIQPNGTTAPAFGIADPASGRDVARKGRLRVDTVVVLYDMLLVWDLLAALAAVYAASYVHHLVTGAIDFADGAFVLDLRDALICAALTPFALRDSMAQRDCVTLREGAVFRRLMRRVPAFVGIVLFAGFATRLLDHVPRLGLLFWGMSTIGLAWAGRFMLARCVQSWRAEGLLREVVAIVGAGAAADRLKREMQIHEGVSIEIVGIFDDRTARVPHDSTIPDGSIEDLVEIGKHEHIDRILVALPWNAEKRLLAILRDLKHLAVEVALCPPETGLRLPQRQVGFMGDVPLMVIADRPLRRWNYLLKLAEDRVLALLALIPLAPVMLLVALAIKFDSPGPVFFRQERVGWNNKSFRVYKFRSMRWDPNASKQIQQTKRTDSRITRIGHFLRKTSLDELPQIFNVLQGQMSMVGPRPHAVSMRTEDRLGHEIVAEYAHRHRVLPGITGWAQVNGYRGATEHVEQLRKRVEYDLYYIENWSVLFDLKILVLTFVTVLSRENAF